MTAREAMSRMLWRFGFAVILAGGLSIIGGAWLVASHFHLNPLPVHWAMTVANMMGAVALGGAGWLTITGWREGVFREHIDPAPYATPLGIPFIAVILFASWPKAWNLQGGENMIFGLALIASGVHTMRLGSHAYHAVTL